MARKAKLELEEQVATSETPRPTNLRADRAPSDGYVLAVDGKMKARFETSEQAMTAAQKLKQSYPVVKITVFDAAAGSYTPIELQE